MKTPRVCLNHDRSPVARGPRTMARALLDAEEPPILGSIYGIHLQGGTLAHADKMNEEASPTMGTSASAVIAIYAHCSCWALG